MLRYLESIRFWSRSKSGSGSWIKSNQIKSNQIKSNQIKSNQIKIKSNQIKSNQIKSNQIKSNQIKSNQIVLLIIWIGGFSMILFFVLAELDFFICFLIFKIFWHSGGPAKKIVSHNLKYYFPSCHAFMRLENVWKFRFTSLDSVKCNKSKLRIQFWKM